MRGNAKKYLFPADAHADFFEVSYSESLHRLLLHRLSLIISAVFFISVWCGCVREFPKVSGQWISYLSLSPPLGACGHVRGRVAGQGGEWEAAGGPRGLADPLPQGPSVPPVSPSAIVSGSNLQLLTGELTNIHIFNGQRHV